VLLFYRCCGAILVLVRWYNGAKALLFYRFCGAGALL
jgi:hypothetical protein